MTARFLALIALLCLPLTGHAQVPTPPALTVDETRLGIGPPLRTITYPVGVKPVGPSPLSAVNGTVTDQTVSQTPDGRWQVTCAIAISGGSPGGKVTLTDTANRLSVDLFNRYAFDYRYPPNHRAVYEGNKGNVFLQPAIPVLPFDNTGNVVTGYEVRDLGGNVVASGRVAPGQTSVRLPSLKRCGSYFIWITGDKSDPAFGNVLGSTVFGITPPTPAGCNLPDLPPQGTFGSIPPYFDGDVATTGYTQAGPYRLYVNDAKNPDIPTLTQMVKALKTAYVTGKDGQVADPVRGRPLMINFPNLSVNNAGELEGVTRVVAAMYPLGVEWYEPHNEPGGDPGAWYVPQVQQFQAAVRAGNPSAKVMGPCGVSTLGNGNFDKFLAAGGGAYLDGFSFHAYNAVNGDFDMGDKTMAAYRAVRAKYGQAGKPTWMTEQGVGMVFAALVTPERALGWQAAQTMVLERWGVPLEHTPYWFPSNGGFWAAGSWLKNANGDFNAPVLMLRRYATETWGSPFATSVDFGKGGSRLWYGNRYDGRGPRAGQSVTVIAAKGTRGDVLRLSASGPKPPPSLITADAWGNETRVPVVHGVVTLPPADGGILRYVRHATALMLTPVGLNFGPDLALNCKVTVPSSQAQAGQLVNGVAENGYDGGFEPSVRVWGSDSHWFQNGGTADGSLTGDTVFPYSIVLDLGAVRPVGRVVIQAPLLWQGLSAIVLADVSTSARPGQWQRQAILSQQSHTVERFFDQLTFASHAIDGFPGQSAWDVPFTPVPARYVRILIRKATPGGQGDLLAAGYGGQPSAGTTHQNTPAQVTLSEIAVYAR